MLPAVHGILPRTQRIFKNIGNPTPRGAEIPSGRMPEDASRMLALPGHERDHHSQRSRDRPCQ
jgi:hypothetical protein